MHSPFTLAVLRAAVPAAANLIERTTEYGLEQRSSQLSALLGDGVIGNVWMHSSEDADTVEASVDVLPIVVRVLGVGTTRCLKVQTPLESTRGSARCQAYQVLIPQLTHSLHPVPICRSISCFNCLPFVRWGRRCKSARQAYNIEGYDCRRWLNVGLHFGMQDC